MKKYAVVTGGTGLIGRALVKELYQNGYSIVLLTRRVIDKIDDIEVHSILWDSEQPRDIKDELDSITNKTKYILINLAGYPIAQSRWSEDVKKKIINSRVNGTEYLAKEMCDEDSNVSLFISASAVGYYGDTKEKVNEDSPKGEGFLSNVCEKWEAASLHSKVETKIIRIGVVLSQSGGALEKIKLPYKYFLGGPIGSGNQYVPWIHIEDIVKGIIYIIESKPKAKVFNMVAPEAVTMSKFSKEIANSMSRPNLFPVPSFILKLMMGEMSSMVLEGQNVIPNSFLNSGYNFEFQVVNKALENMV